MGEDARYFRLRSCGMLEIYNSGVILKMVTFHDYVEMRDSEHTEFEFMTYEVLR